MSGWRCPECGFELDSPGLTPSALLCLAGVAAGLTAKEIARARGRSVSTVKHELDTARERLGSRNLAEAVRRAIEQGYELSWTPPEERGERNEKRDVRSEGRGMRSETGTHLSSHSSPLTPRVEGGSRAPGPAHPWRRGLA